MTERQESGFELRRDGLGILLFTSGAFFSVLLVLALSSAGPLEKAEGTAAIARLWAGSIGLFPALLLCGGCAILGARLFLAGSSDLLRRLAGLALVSLGLSVLMGAFSGSAGGLVGSSTAGALSRATNVVAGALLGIGALGAAVWIAWLRPARGVQRPAGPMDEIAEDRVKPAAPQASDLGVTAAEAAALIPSELPIVPNPIFPNPAVAVTTRRIDIRRSGELPEGARPLFSPHVHTPTPPSSPQPIDEPSAPSVEHWAPAPEPGLSADAADEDLARTEEPEFVLEPVASIALDAVEPEDASEPEDEIEIEEILSEPEPKPKPEPEPKAEAPDEDEEEEAELETEADVDSDDSEPVLRPSWEQPTLFHEEEEPVDAYGTPLVHIPAQEEPLDLVEDDVVLQPAPAPVKENRIVRDRGEVDHSRFLAEVGCLFVDRGRVAVSMLQKQFDMDFEEATEVLDELQALGLIGPYLGGQRRDILLTRDEWLEKVSSL